ncbi:MAG TPA: hypothetical protein VFA09_22860 [Ktedonobacteraceae bacterium]|nr:hypothetical protein [Ktedonobacteraceae bacterium]
MRSTKILLLLSQEHLGLVEEVFEEEYPGWRWLARTVTWPPTLLGVVEIPLREGARDVTEILAEWKRTYQVDFAALAPAAAGEPSEAESRGAIWQEEATEPYHILFAMDPTARFVLVFPLERTDVAERIQPVPSSWRDSADPLRYRFVMTAQTHTALWLTELREASPEFVVSPSAEAVMNDLLNLPGLDWFPVGGGDPAS